jgi:hypothetical protein
MYLPDELSDARVLITVKTYPLPSNDFGEVVCTAGLLNGEKWIRIYPILMSKYTDEVNFPKYCWIKVNLVKHPSDNRVESYMPRNGIDEPLYFLDKIGTVNFWAARKDFVMREIFTSMEELISLSRHDNRSLGTLKPLEIVDFIIEDSEWEWKPQWAVKLKQMKLFDPDTISPGKQKQPIKKIPYTFKYRFLTRGDSKPRELSIHDWEISMLYMNCLRQSGGDEMEAKQLVQKRYFDEFVTQKDIYLFLGTTYEFHKRRASNPFIIIGVFYPPKTTQLSLFYNP